MRYNIVKQLSCKQGQALSNRYKVRAFKYAEQMHTFLNKGDNALHWKEIHENLKSGTYFTQTDRDGTRYINVKALQL